MIEKITPETYIKMNEEFEREGTPIHIIVPTQEEIDNPKGVKLPTTFPNQKPMIVDGTDPSLIIVKKSLKCNTNYKSP